MQGTVRQQCAQFPKTRCKRRRQGGVGAEWDKHDGPFTAEQATRSFGVDRTMKPQVVEAIMSRPGKHHGQRLGRTAFSITEAVYCRMRGSVAKQVITADASHRHDAARSQSLNATRQCGLVATYMLRSMADGERGPASCTCDELGVESPIFGLLVFCPA